MKNLKLFSSIAEAIGRVEKTPIVAAIADIADKAMYASTDKFGDEIMIISSEDGFIEPTNEIGPRFYDVLKQVNSYTIPEDNTYGWYTLTNASMGIIRFDETTAVPTGTPNFGDKYLPSFIMNLRTPLNLNQTPLMTIEAFTLNSCPLNFKFIDANGKCSAPIITGSNDNRATRNIIFNMSSHQERGDILPTKLTAINHGGYTNATTAAAITTQIGKLVAEYDANGSFDSSKCYLGQGNIFTDLEDPFTAEEGFDRTNIVKIEVQLVETWDKSSITWKARNKAYIFNQFRFDEVVTPKPFKTDEVNRIEDVYASVSSDERVVFITRHAARGNDTSITGDLNATGIQQCKTLGAKLSNTNIDLTKTYIGGSLKYRAKNTAYQITKAMGVEYPADYDYITDTKGYDELMEVNFFQDAQGESAGVNMEQNAYFSYISEDGYDGPNKIPNLVDTKSQEIIDMVVGIAINNNYDLCWFGSHDKVVQPMMAYTTGRKNPIHLVRANKEGYVKMKPLPYSGYVGNWSTPLISGLAIIINKRTGEYKIYPVESGL